MREHDLRIKKSGNAKLQGQLCKITGYARIGLLHNLRCLASIDRLILAPKLVLVDSSRSIQLPPAPLNLHRDNRSRMEDKSPPSLASSIDFKRLLSWTDQV